jgi:radical SAM superfamily enzyme YgiQ (UPF0313 family)
LDDIPGLVWRDGVKIVSNQQIFPNDLDNLGFPSWDLIHPEEYPRAPLGFFLKGFPYVPLNTSRGCPYPCTFCGARTIVGHKVRYRSVENIMTEIENLYTTYGVREIHVVDDNFTFDRKFVVRFCERIINSQLSICFSSPNGVRLDTLDQDLLLLMKRAGWYLIFVGIESGSQIILERMKKGLTKEKMREKITLIKNAGLETAGYFIVGYPGETKLEIEESISFSKELNLDWAQFSTFIPLPNTPIFKELRTNGRLELHWEKFCDPEVAYQEEGLEVKKMLKKAYLKFYLRPKIIAKLLKKLKSGNIIFFITRVWLYLTH